MNLNAVWMYCILMLMIGNFARGSGCKWMHPRDEGAQSKFKEVSYHCIQLLEQMGDAVTQRISNPQTLNRLYEHTTNLQAGERIIFIHEAVNSIQELYINGKHDGVTWNPKKLQKFQVNLDRQASELQQCIRKLKSRASHPSSYKKIKTYFKRLLLESKNYSTSDWEAVRAEVLIHLRRLDIIGSVEQ
ncbi:hypothetical protein SKAU_G00296550 [Synaphobranchus kaupii]|uniref:Uncharacterized protein n=1 Tax=Synaphobranchus kaupii TaxID=118154 RepID=A0A9Q1ILW0_SYNKA|nr:hypothetical protein SKAU_G00296550 [Synaphobranchus kaupii]